MTLERVNRALVGVENFPTIPEDLNTIQQDIRDLRRAVDAVQDRQVGFSTQLHEVHGTLRGFFEEMRVRLSAYPPGEVAAGPIGHTGAGAGRGGRSR